jgi:hypothetical protein
MKIFRIWLNKRKWILLVSGSVLFMMLGSCAFLRISRPIDVVAYFGMMKSGAPIFKDLALRRVRMGDSMSKLSQRYPNVAVVKFGRFSMLEDFHITKADHPDCVVIAKDGKLVAASANGILGDGLAWSFTFFQFTNDGELARQLRLADAEESRREAAAWGEEFVK